MKYTCMSKMANIVLLLLLKNRTGAETRKHTDTQRLTNTTDLVYCSFLPAAIRTQHVVFVRFRVHKVISLLIIVFIVLVSKTKSYYS